MFKLIISITKIRNKYKKEEKPGIIDMISSDCSPLNFSIFLTFKLLSNSSLSILIANKIALSPKSER